MAHDKLRFTSRTHFEQFLSERPEQGTAFAGAKLGEPFDISNNLFIGLIRIELLFASHEGLWFAMHPETNEVVVADINTGGHGAHSRIVRVRRSDILNDPRSMQEWYDNYALKIWP